MILKTKRLTVGLFLLGQLLVVGLCESGRAEFSQRQQRYASGYTVLNLLIKNFPGHGQDRAAVLSLRCYSLNQSNRDALGDASPLSGTPLMAKPNPGFLRWLSRCLGEYSKMEFDTVPAYRSGFLEAYVPAALIQKYVGANGAGPFLDTPWSSLPADARRQIIDRTSVLFLGPPSIFLALYPDRQWSDFVSSIEATVAGTTGPSSTVRSALMAITRSVFLRDEFLRY